MSRHITPGQGYPEGAYLLLPLRLYQLGNTIAELGAPGAPEIRTLGINPDLLFTAGRDRIEKADALDVAPVPPVAAIGNHDVVEGALLGAAA
jgi:hypothetical protein